MAHGWLRRAHRLLEGVEPCAEYGWLACLARYIAFIHHADSVVALKAGAEAAGIGRSLCLLDLEMVGLRSEAQGQRLGAVQPVAMPALKEMLDELVAQRVPIYV